MPANDLLWARAGALRKKLSDAHLLYDHAYGATLDARTSRAKAEIHEEVEKLLLAEFVAIRDGLTD